MPYFPIESKADFLGRIKIGKTTEGLHLDFKQEVNFKKGDAQAELCRDLAQFANTEGGTLLIGVEEAKGPNGHKVASRILGVQDVDGLKQWAEQAITNYCVPSTFSKTVSPISLNEGTVLAINVPPSIHLVALWHRDQRGGLRRGAIEYLYRTNHGKEWMNPDAAERHLMDGSRATRLAVTRLFARKGAKSTQLEIVPAPLLDNKGGFSSKIPHPRPAFLRELGDQEFGIVIDSANVSIPFALVEAAWITTDGRPAIALKVSITQDGDRLYLAPMGPRI